MPIKNLRSALGTLLVGAMLLTAAGCGDSPEPTAYTAGTLDVSMVAGPDASRAVAHGSKVTFRWQPMGGSGEYLYEYSIDGGAVQALPAGQTSLIITDTAILTTGNHTLSLTVKDANNATATKTITRAFVISAPGTNDTLPPEVEFTYPSTGYKTAPGSTVRFEWTVDDESNATEAGVLAGVAAIGYALNDTAAAATWAPSADIVLAAAVDNVPLGTHTFYVKAVDNSGNVTVATSVFDVIAPTIFIIDEASLEPGYDGDVALLSASRKFQRNTFRNSIFDGYSYEVWDATGANHPTTADVPASVETIVWLGSGDFQNTSWGWYWGYEYSFGHSDLSVSLGYIPAKYDAPNIITDAIDAGKNVWVVSENWLNELAWEGVAHAGSMEYDYLGFPLDAPTTGAYWSYYDVNAVVFDLAQSGTWTDIEWPSLSTDIGKVDYGIGDYYDWSVDALYELRADVLPIYEVTGMETNEGPIGPVPAGEGPYYVGWTVLDGTGDPQVVMMTFDLYYFSLESATKVTQNVLSGLFGH